MTFHWATNYGAVLQAYAMQQYLVNQGHHVEIINYKPRRYDWIWFRTILRHPQTIVGQYMLWKRERSLSKFRANYLSCTSRYYSSTELQKLSSAYDIIISGSDQILNPSFTHGGEGHPTSAYYLGFADNSTLRIGYAVSFGCLQYPVDVAKEASEWIQSFDAIGYREQSGHEILLQLCYYKTLTLVPDPTILYGKRLFEDLSLLPQRPKKQICVYLLGNTRINCIKDIKYIHIDERHRAFSMEDWLSNILDSEGLITNSYHGMIMAIMLHTPFVTISKKQAGQNDRIMTVLTRLGLGSRIVDNDDEHIYSTLYSPIAWDEVDAALTSFQKDGILFLQKVFTYKK